MPIRWEFAMEFNRGDILIPGPLWSKLLHNVIVAIWLAMLRSTVQ